jgi:hypothetical protein
MKQRLGGGKVRDWGPLAAHVLVQVYGGWGLGAMVRPLAPGETFYSAYSPGRVSPAIKEARHRARREARRSAPTRPTPLERDHRGRVGERAPVGAGVAVFVWLGR